MKITNMKKLAAACTVCAVFAMLTGCGKYIGRNGMRSESTVQTSNIQTDSAPTESVDGTESAADQHGAAAELWFDASGGSTRVEKSFLQFPNAVFRSRKQGGEQKEEQKV